MLSSFPPLQTHFKTFTGQRQKDAARSPRQRWPSAALSLLDTYPAGDLFIVEPSFAKGSHEKPQSQ